MEAPVLYAQESDAHPDKVAYMASFVPNFIEKDKVTDDYIECEEERPDPQDMPQYSEGDNMFIFIVDRSGSMSGSKMETTKDALILFLKSLPTGSRFEIINFGTDYDMMSKSKEGFQYDDSTVKNVIEQVRQMNSNYGGTNILRPLLEAIKVIKTQLNKRIFLLTDGEVDDRDKVVQLAMEAP